MKISTVETFKHIAKSDNNIELEGTCLESLQHVLAKMLEDISSCCHKNNIAYTLGGGTCLGAIRHQGFIPWDDDVDINMLRSDYARFKEALLQEFPDKYYIQEAALTPSYTLAFPRVRLKGTVLKSREDLDLPNDECGVYVDIFLAENTPDNFLVRSLHGFGSMCFGLAYSCRRFAAYKDSFLALAADNKQASRAFKIKIALGKLLSFFSAQKWTCIWDNWNAKCKNNESRYISFPVGRGHYFTETYARDSFFPAKKAEFEQFNTCVPKDANAYLTKLYGLDYMQEPPADKRETHVVYEFDLGSYAI